MESKFYGLKCITNLFVGNGDNSYGIIDNQVEKDPILETPIIPSSSLKGSLRDFFENNSDIINLLSILILSFSIIVG